MSLLKVFCKLYYNWKHILISAVWLSLLPEANSFSNATGALSNRTKKCVRVFMDSESDINDKQIVAILQDVHCNALWRHRNFLRFETHTYTKNLYETITYAIFVCITLDELLNSQKWTQFILFWGSYSSMYLVVLKENEI